MADTNSMIVEIDGRMVLDRVLGISILAARDGYTCTYPGCTTALSDDPNSDHVVTIDHIFPQARARSEGWTFEEIWDISNLQLMGRRCNARKGDALYNDDGSLPLRGRQKAEKVPRPDKCDSCNNGRLLGEDELCRVCGSQPQPITAPAYLQVPSKDCKHGWDGTPQFCWACFIGVKPRPATEAPGGAFGDSL